ncbi:MAG: cyclophilin-like family protein [Hyphomicrobiaceae bacterium]
MRHLLIESSGVRIRARLLANQTAEIVWLGLPLHSTLRFWGRLVWIDTPFEAYRELSSRDVLKRGEIAFIPDRDDIVLGYGATPIATAGEIRVPGLATVFAEALDDVEALRDMVDGAVVSITRLTGSARASVPAAGRR